MYRLTARPANWVMINPTRAAGSSSCEALAISGADILLMDEPFSALDPLISQGLQDELLELQRKLSKTIVFVSHDLDEALKLGSHIAIMKDGRSSSTACRKRSC